MKTLEVLQRGGISRHIYKDAAMADESHSAIKAAMVAYHDRMNDRERVLTFKIEGGEATVTVADVLLVTLSDMDASVEVAIEREIWARRVDARVTAALAPPA